jgi:hypothetical protein
VDGNIRANRRIAVEEIRLLTGISHGSVHAIVTAVPQNLRAVGSTSTHGGTEDSENGCVTGSLATIP